MKIKELFTKKEIQYLENLWSTHNLSIEEGWEFIAESKENLMQVINNQLWPWYAAEGWLLGDAQDRVREILNKWEEK